jgi:hypothetical protein
MSLQLNMLGGASPVLESMEALIELIGSFDPSGKKWREEWQAARSVFVGASKRAVLE